MNGYRTIAHESEIEIVIKKSRFIGYAFLVSSAEEANEKLAALRKRQWDASHHCSAYVLGADKQLQKYSDDGEPQGTAGMPILQVLHHKDVTNTMVVVVRYFGGVLLGAGGLTRAYTKGAKDALDAAGISVVRRWIEVLLPCSYAQYERMKLETEGFGGVIAEADYGADIALTVLLPEERADAFLAHILDVTAGTVEGLVCGERFQDVPWRPPVWKEGGPHG